MQCYHGMKSVAAVTGVGSSLSTLLAGSNFTSSLGYGNVTNGGEILYFFCVSNTATTHPSPTGGAGTWTLVAKGAIGTGTWSLWRHVCLAAEQATTFQIVSGASGIWGMTFALFVPTKSGTLNVESEAVNNNVAATSVAVPAGSSTHAYALAVALVAADFEQNLDTVMPSQSIRYVNRAVGGERGVFDATCPRPYYRNVTDASPYAVDSFPLTSSLASLAATVVISETATSGHAAVSSVEAKGDNASRFSGNPGTKAKSSAEAARIKGTPSDIDQVFTRQGYGGGVQIW